MARPRGVSARIYDGDKYRDQKHIPEATMPNPLDETFNVSDKNFLDDEYIGVVIPEDPNLDTIANLALKAYKEQMDDIMHIEPKNRARYLEVAEKFLNQAKDAIAKKEQIKASREKLAPKHPSKANTPAAEPEVGLTRKELFEQQRQLSVVK